MRSSEGWYWVLMGKPQATTGECVASVREAWGHDQALWDAFGACTNTLLDTMEQTGDQASNLVEVIKENHRLLQRIGVVPDFAARFISEIEEAGGAAKVSGAGSIRGDAAGVLLVHMPDSQAMASVMARHPNLRWERIEIDMDGAGLSDTDNSLINRDAALQLEGNN